MTGKQIKVLLILLLITIISLFINFIFGIIMAFIILMTANIMKAYNNYKKAEIEKEIYNDIKNKKA